MLQANVLEAAVFQVNAKLVTHIQPAGNLISLCLHSNAGGAQVLILRMYSQDNLVNVSGPGRWSSHMSTRGLPWCILVYLNRSWNLHCTDWRYDISAQYLLNSMARCPVDGCCSNVICCTNSANVAHWGDGAMRVSIWDIMQVDQLVRNWGGKSNLFWQQVTGGWKEFQARQAENWRACKANGAYIRTCITSTGKHLCFFGSKSNLFIAMCNSWPVIVVFFVISW